MSIELLNEILDYNPNSGEFTHKNRDWPNAWRNGKKAGCANCVSGYIQIRIGGEIYYAHRLAWLITYGSWPKNQIDHINGVRNDNRIANLRDVTSYKNQRNRPTNGRIQGVCWDECNNSWIVSIADAHLCREKDFFEACCLRKSEEYKHGYICR